MPNDTFKPHALPYRTLDYTEIKSRFREHLRNQDHWKDYEFEGNGLDILLSVMANSLHQHAFVAHMLANEMHLDSATQLDQAISRAKLVNYIPRSVRAAKATVDLIIQGDDLPNTVFLEKGSLFTSDDAGSNQTFVTTESYSVTPGQNQEYVLNGVEVYQGNYGVIDYVVDRGNPVQKFSLPTANIDTSLIEVFVQEGQDETVLSRYQEADTIIDLDGESRAYFIEADDDGRYRVIFGDGVLGREVGHEKIVRIIYFETAGEDGNGFSNLRFSRTPSTNPINDANVTVVTTGRSHGGAEPDDIDTIKFHAPRTFASQRRGLSDVDYKSIILRNFPDIKSVEVWGGETEANPIGKYGRIFVSLNPYEEIGITQARIDEILDELKSRYAMVGAVTFVHVEPSFVYILPTVQVHIDPLAMLDGPDDIKQRVLNAIHDYGVDNLERFSSGFEYSRFLRMIDDIDPVIVGNSSQIKIQIRLNPVFNNLWTYFHHFFNEVEPTTVRSNRIMFRNVTAWIEDNGTGRLRVRRESNNRVIESNIGSINYMTGQVTLTNLNIQGIVDAGNILRLTAEPVHNTLRTRRNGLLRMSRDDASVTIVTRDDR